MRSFYVVPSIGIRWREEIIKMKKIEFHLGISNSSNLSLYKSYIFLSTITQKVDETLVKNTSQNS